MERVEGAPFFKNEMVVDDLATNVQDGGSYDAFVNELLDFANVVEEVEEENQTINTEEEETTACEVVKKSDFVPHFSFQDEFCVPANDLVSLEWLSHFVADSNSEYSTPFPAGISPQILKQKRTESETEPVFFKTPVPGKARSRRNRTGIPVQALSSAASLTESCSSSSTAPSPSSITSSAWLICTNNYPGAMVQPGPVCDLKSPVKGQKKKSVEGEGSSGLQRQARRCSHCGVQKTPQWRAGPNGAKTLCNACGVRFKSGRLFPEYRPACSPTFSSELHSNHHRKVLEMRMKKEVLGGVQIGQTSTFATQVPGFL